MPGGTERQTDSAGQSKKTSGAEERQKERETERQSLSEQEDRIQGKSRDDSGGGASVPAGTDRQAASA